MDSNSNSAPVESASANTPKPHTIRVGSGDGRTIVGFVGGVGFANAKPGAASGTITLRAVTGKDREGNAHRTVGVRGNPYGTSVTLHAGETAAILTSLGIPANATRATLAGSREWGSFVTRLLAGTRDARGTILSIPNVERPPKAGGRKSSAPRVNPADAAIADLLARLNG